MNEAFAELLAMVAKEHGVTAGEVYRDIEIAIEDAMQSTDPEAQRMWAEMPRKGIKPTPEEFIAYMSRRVEGMQYRLKGLSCAHGIAASARV